MSAEPSSLHARARVHAALGDPARLAIVDLLAFGDASPGEVSAELRLPTNLVAHHVKVLEAAGLVTRSRSEGDRRRTYLRLEPDPLVRLAPPRPAPVGRVVFVCTHNSARSQLAAGLWRQRSGQPGASAGTRPAGQVHPKAVAVARRHGLRLDPARTAHLHEVVGAGDVVIAVCDNAYEDLIDTREDAPDRARPRLHWSIPDPVRAGTDAAFEAAFAELARRIDRLAPGLTGGADHD